MWCRGIHERDEFAGHGVIEGVASFAGDDVGLHGATDEREIADEVEKFVTSEFVFEAQFIVDGRGEGVVDDQQIARGEVGEEAADAEEFGFTGEAEGAGGGDVFGVASGGLIAATFPVGVLCDGESAGAGDVELVAK